MKSVYRASDIHILLLREAELVSKATRSCQVTGTPATHENFLLHVSIRKLAWIFTYLLELIKIFIVRLKNVISSLLLELSSHCELLACES